jgi:hypothetical protein
MNNPLSQYFRQPSIYIKLPSGGKFYPAGSINVPTNQEFPVLPMTAIDEITYRTPDALFNGSATVNVIQSCVPNITDAWMIPAMDLDTILIGIRIASHGHEMEFETTCPKCNHTSEHVLDLRSVLDRIQAGDYSQPIRFGDIEIYLRPMSYKNLNDNNLVQFEQQKIIQSLPETNMPESEKMNALSIALSRVTDLTVSSLAQSIGVIKTPTAMVSESEYLAEFLKNCDRKLFNTIRDTIVDLKSKSEMQPMDLSCPECTHTYKQMITMDMTSFFESAS